MGNGLSGNGLSGNGPRYAARVARRCQLGPTASSAATRGRSEWPKWEWPKREGPNWEGPKWEGPKREGPKWEWPARPEVGRAGGFAFARTVARAQTHATAGTGPSNGRTAHKQTSTLARTRAAMRRRAHTRTRAGGVQVHPAFPPALGVRQRSEPRRRATYRLSPKHVFTAVKRTVCRIGIACMTGIVRIRGF